MCRRARTDLFCYQSKVKDKKMKNLVCYCFRYSIEDIQRDYMKNGRSTIMEKIQTEKKFGNCQCAAKNPKGK